MVCLRLCLCLQRRRLETKPLHYSSNTGSLGGRFQTPALLFLPPTVGRSRTRVALLACQRTPNASAVVYTDMKRVVASAGVCLVLSGTHRSRPSLLFLQNQSVGLDVQRVYTRTMEPRLLNVAQKVSPGTHRHMKNTHTHTHAEQRACSACYMFGRQTEGLEESGSRTDPEPELLGLFHGKSPHSQINVAGRGLDASLPALQTLYFFFIICIPAN